MIIYQEFKEFAVKGNMIDMAIGIIIGTAFGRIITSLVEGNYASFWFPAWEIQFCNVKNCFKICRYNSKND